MFSLITGKYRQAKRYGTGDKDASPAPAVDGETPSAVVLRNQENALSVLSDSAASEYPYTNSVTWGG